MVYPDMLYYESRTCKSSNEAHSPREISLVVADGHFDLFTEVCEGTYE